VKNNLQTVSSLLAMAGMGTKNPEASMLLHDAESRVHAMALIHSQLYGSKRLDRISVKQNIRELTDRLGAIYSARARGIAYSVEGDDASLSIHQAIPCALAVNEIVTNAFKYAFQGKPDGSISVKVGRSDGVLSIAIADNGIGLPDGFDVDLSDTLGVKLVKNLVEGQLGGRVDFASPGGARVTISFTMEGQGNGAPAPETGRGIFFPSSPPDQPATESGPPRPPRNGARSKAQKRKEPA
jgi:two-component sensor histidine kinase